MVDQVLDDGCDFCGSLAGDGEVGSGTAYVLGMLGTTDLAVVIRASIAGVDGDLGFESITDNLQGFGQGGEVVNDLRREFSTVFRCEFSKGKVRG